MPNTLTGRVIADKYEVRDLLGSGGMGDVYRARHTALDTDVAIKVLRTPAITDPAYLKRFTREARATCQLRHPNIIQVLDFGQTDDGLSYMVMELIKGTDLYTVAQRTGGPSHQDIVHICIQICSALDEAHANGIIHRDLKPENIMIESRRTESLHVKVVDFGIAKMLDPNTGVPHGTKVTRDGLVCGTAEYMSPEQAQGKVLNGSADLYSLGVIMYELIAGELPFTADSPVEILTKHLLRQPKDIRGQTDNLDEDLAQLVMQLLHKEIAQRPKSAHKVLERLTAVKKRWDDEDRISRSDTKLVVRPVNQLHTRPTTTHPETPQPYTLDLARQLISRPTRRTIGIMTTVAVLSLGALVMPWFTQDKVDIQVPHIEMPIAQQEPATTTPAPEPANTEQVHIQTVKQIVRESESDARSDRETIEVSHQPYITERPKPRPSYRELINKAHAAKTQSQWRIALSYYKKALTIRRTAGTYKEVARMHLKLNQTKQACRYFKRYIKTHKPVDRADATARIAHYLSRCK